MHQWTYRSQVDPQGSPWRLRLPTMGTLCLTAGCGAIFSLLPTQWQRPKNAVKDFNGRQRQMCACAARQLGSNSNNNTKATRNDAGSVPQGPGAAWILEYLNAGSFCKYRTFSGSVWCTRGPPIVEQPRRKCQFLRGGAIFRGSMDHFEKFMLPRIFWFKVYAAPKILV